MEGKMHKKREKYQKEMRRRDTVCQISRMPGNCPVGKCTDIIFPSDLMMHMLHRHANAANCTTAEIYEHCPLSMYFNPTGYAYEENFCMASLLYGGVKDKSKTQPGISCLSLANSGLVNDHHKYENYLPIMMMVCHSSWYAQLKDKHKESRLVAKHGSKAGVYVFWLVSPTTTNKVYYTLTIYDRHYVNSHSVMRVVRNYTSLNNPSDFLPHESNYMLLRDSQVAKLMSVSNSSSTTMGKQQEPGIPMDLIVYETPIKSKEQRSHRTADPVPTPAKDQNAKHTMPRTKGLLKRGILVKMPNFRKQNSKASVLSNRLSN